MAAEISDKAEASPVVIGDFTIYPYSQLKDAREGLAHAADHFREDFRVRSYGKGYFLASPNTVTDARGFVVSNDSPLEGGKDAFYRILHESRVVE